MNGSSSVNSWSQDWHETLYIQPGKWIQWVVVTTVGIVGVLAGITYVLHMKEKVSVFAGTIRSLSSD